MRSVTRAIDAARAWAESGGSRRTAWAATLREGFDWAYDKAVNGLPGVAGAEKLAARYAARHGDADAAVAALILRQSGVASATGFVTGCGGFVVLPVAMPANLASALYIQARLIAAIAQLRGHDIKSAEVRALALACLTGSKAADTLKDAGVRFGTRLGRDVIGWASPMLVRKTTHVAAALPPACAAGAAGVGRLGRFVPVIGGVVAGGFDAAMTMLIGRTADRVFRRPPADRPLGPGAAADALDQHRQAADQEDGAAIERVEPAAGDRRRGRDTGENGKAQPSIADKHAGQLAGDLLQQVHRAISSIGRRANAALSMPAPRNNRTKASSARSWPGQATPSPSPVQ
jgi:hypothetical protein